MAVFAFYVEKTMQFEGGLETFGNVYHYRTNFYERLAAEGIANRLGEAEAGVLPGFVTIPRCLVWGPTDTGNPQESVMREAVQLDMAGSITETSLDPYRTVSVLVQWPLPRSTPLNRVRFLRKFYRPAAENLIGGSAARGITPITQARRDSFLNAGDVAVGTPISTLRTLSVGETTAELCTELGDLTTGDAVVSRFVTTRQVKV